MCSLLQPRLLLNVLPSCFCLLSTEITHMYHHVQLVPISLAGFQKIEYNFFKKCFLSVQKTFHCCLVFGFTHLPYYVSFFNSTFCNNIWRNCSPAKVHGPCEDTSLKVVHCHVTNAGQTKQIKLQMLRLPVSMEFTNTV